MNTIVIYGALALTGVAFVMFFLKGKKKAESTSNLRFDKPIESSPRISLPSVKKLTKRDDQIQVRVFYGSQTGTAEDFGGTLVKEAKNFDAFFPVLTPLDDYNFDDLQNEKLVIYCVATYGEGEPTDNAKDFFEWIMDPARANDCDLSSVKFTVFGLGNKTYEHFNHIARKLDTRLAELGGKRVYEKGEGDDDASLQEDFENWKGNLWEAVCREFNVSASQVSKVQNPSYLLKTYEENIKLSSRVTWNKQKYDERITDVKNPKYCKIIRKVELHSAKSDRSCIHVEVELPQGMTYQAGDHLGIFATNDYDEVLKLAKRLNVKLNDVISLHLPNQASAIVGPVTVEKLLLHFVDIVSSPKPEVLKVLADLYTQDPTEKERLNYLSSMGPGREEYNKWIKNAQRTLFEILEEFPSCTPPLHHIAELLPNMLPRYYSISSSIKENPGAVHLTAVVVKYRTETGRLHKGVCTSYLDARNVGDEVPCFIRTSTFRLPRNPKAPVIMIGPGTGIAPFRGFLQERRHLNPEHRGESVLFFGCRARDVDFLYEEELTRHMEDGSLTKLITAFSREQDEKVYVQDKIKEFSDEIWTLLQNPLCHVYVCGDAKAMAKDVHKALKQVVMDSGKKSQHEAESFITNLQKAAPTSRYQQDVWT